MFHRRFFISPIRFAANPDGTAVLPPDGAGRGISGSSAVDGCPLAFDGEREKRVNGFFKR